MGLSTFGDLALVVIGFSLIIFLHELGHFVAARWARVRVLAFAMGFGPALVSFRKGLGWRRGSSEKEYQRRLKEHRRQEEAAGVPFRGVDAFALSPTEYRINVLPLGGYVKMLGQDDSDPGATSSEPDSFTSAPVYKRMVIISAGVVMNIITAAVLFIIVFSAGLRTESPRIGTVVPGSPADTAVATVGATRLTGLKPGDTVVAVGDDAIESFNDIGLAVAMSRKDRPLAVSVRRAGFDEPITFVATPKADPGTNLLSIGVYPAFSGTLHDPAPSEEQAVLKRLANVSEPDLRPGMTLCDAAGYELDANWLEEVAQRSGGSPMQTLWLPAGDGKGKPVPVAITPEPEFQLATVERDRIANSIVHLAGLTPVMAVGAVTKDGNAEKAGLKAGDIIAQLGDVQWPSLDEGLRQIKQTALKSLHIVVLREGALVDLKEVAVTEGRIGILQSTSAQTDSLITRFPRGVVTEADAAAPRDTAHPFAAIAAEVTPGSRIVKVGDRQTGTLVDVRAALQELIRAGQHDIHMTLALPGPAGADGQRPTRAVVLHLEDADAKAVAALGWTNPIPGQFLPSQVLIKRSGPVAAVAKGLQETKKMILTTYLTFARLFQGSVKVEHLKGPIGIADVGTKLAGRGTIWLLFFMAAVSVNLAVVNFLPLPIVDGGHFCFLLWEQFTGRPVSPAVQNVAALVGLVLIGAVFLMTTYNDLANLWR